MTISALDRPSAVAVTIDDQSLSVELSDGRTIAAPLAWYPRLLHATPKERACWRLVADGEGIHWPDLDEDVSVEGLIAGRPSMETADSLAHWLAGRQS
jgi:hypothetical protein